HQAEKLEALSLLAGGLAHKFNNLLTPIIGYTSLLQLEQGNQPALLPLLERVMESAERAGELADAMLTYAGRREPVLAPLHLTDVLGSAAKAIGPTLPGHIRLELDVSADLPTGEADPSLGKQLLANLITNAAEAIGERPGTITLRLSAGAMTEEDL